MKQYFEAGLIYEGHKIMPYCSRCGTPLASHEVSLGYKEEKVNSIYVRMKVVGKENEYFLVWTTTPWTLPSNVALAVNAAFTYVKARGLVRMRSTFGSRAGGGGPGERGGDPRRA